MEKEFQHVNAIVSDEIRALRREVEKEFGNTARIAARIGGPILSWTARREEKRLAAGRTYEPPTFVDRRNWATANAFKASFSRQ